MTAGAGSAALGLRIQSKSMQMNEGVSMSTQPRRLLSVGPHLLLYIMP